MANSLGNRLARIDVLIGGADQARKQVDKMRDEWKKLRKEVENAQEQMNATTNTTLYDDNKKIYNEKVKQLERLTKLIRENQRNVNTVNKYLNDISGQTLRNLGEARKGLNQMLLGINPKNAETLQTVRDYIKQIADEIQRRKGNLVEFSDIIGDIGNVSDKSLGMAKERLQDLVKSTQLNTQEIQKYRDQLAQVEAEETHRVSQRAQSTLGKVQTGAFDGTIGQTKEAIKLLEQYKQQLKISDTKGLKEIEDAIGILNEKLKKASTEVINLDEALDKAGQISMGTFDGTLQDLDKLKKSLEEYRAQIKLIDTETVKQKIKSLEGQIAVNDTEEVRKELEKYQKLLRETDPAGLKKINDALDAINKKQKEVVQSTVNVDKVIKRIRTAPLEDLQKAAAQLQKELTESVRGTEEYIKTSAKLRQVTAQINKVKKSWEEHDNQIVATAKRLTSYVLVYAGFNEIVSRIQQMAQANFELSDSMADIQKTTGLSSEEIANLSKNIDKIDTRSAQEQLYSLAASAGQAGLKTEEDVLGFVRAADQLTIALNELGNEGVNTLLKISNLTGEGKLLGTEKALLAIGSSINELSAASSATAGPITDIINRIGSVASVSKITMAEMAALGAVMDENAESAEVAGTALTSFISALQTNTRSIAMAVGVDDKMLEDMIKAGKTMDAMLVVLGKLRGMSEEDGLKAIAPIMKEFGSEGGRMNRVITTLSQNTDILRSRVELSRQAYAEATSVTNEANIKQESAIGIVNRLGNEIKETFVNSNAVERLKEFLSVILDFVKWLKSGADGAEVFKTAVTSLVLGLASFTVAAKAAGAAIFTANTYTTLWKEGFTALNTAMKKNVVGLVTAGIVALGYAFYDLMTKVSDITKATNDYNRELERERLRVDSLFEGAKKENQEKDVKLKLINQINDRYGDYIGFLLTEADSNEKLSAAQELVNAKIRERLSLLLKEKLQEQAAEKTASGVSTALGNIKTGLEETQGISDARSDEALRIVQQIVNRDIKKPVDEIIKQVYESLREKFSSKENAYTYQDFFNINEDVREYINVLKDYDKAVDAAVSETEEKINAANQDVKDANTKMLNAITSEWDELQKVKTDSLDENQLSSHNEKLKKTANEYIKIAKQQITLLSGEEKKQLQSYVDFYEKAISQVEKTSKKKEPNIWGYGRTIDDASVDQLVAKYDQLFKERKTMREDADYSTAYAKEFKDRAEAMDWYMKKLKEIEAQLNKMGYNTSGNLLKGKSGTRGEQKEMNDEMTAALSALETYFVSREALIKERRASEEITEQEMNRQIEDNEFAHLTARIKLRRMFLGDMKALSKEELETYGLEGKDLEKLSNYLLDKGQAMRDGIRLKLAEDELKMREDLLKRQAAIRKILLDNDYTGQVDKEFMSAIDKLELLFGKQEDMTEEAGERRMSILRSMASEAYLIDVTEFQKRIDAQTEFSEWRKDKTTEDYQALLYMLQKYNDDYEAAENRAIERRKKIAEKKWEKSGQKEDWQTKTDKSQANVDLTQSASSIGLASDSMVEDAKLEYYKLRIEASKAYLMQMEQEMQMEVDKAYQEKLLADEIYNITKGTDYEDEDARLKALEATATYEAAKRAQMQMTLDARQQLNEAMIDLDKQEMEIQERKLETLKGYTDAIVEFSGQMGEAAFGEVEDRKEAAKQLVQTTMKLTKDLIMQKVQELITKKALKQQEVAIEQTGNQSITKSAGSTIIAGLTASEKGMGGKISGAIAGGSAKIIEELGWWGIPLIAVITTALNGLMGLAMGAFSKSKAEVAAATGASTSQKGRVAAGMLTYAEGDYPVLGNDGQIYNARYQKELKTGVYGGGAHFGIFSEKKPEMIVDGDTTQKLILNYPHIYESILTIARHGQLKRAAMPAFAGGSYPSMPTQVQQSSVAAADAGMSNAQMAQTLADVANAVAALTDRLNKPISATMDPYEANKTLRKTNTFMEKKGLIK